MALLLIEGWDQYDDDDEIIRGGWSTNNAGGMASIASPVHGTLGRAIEISTSGTILSHNVPTSSATIVMGFAMQLKDTGPVSAQLVRLWEGTGVQGELTVTNSGELEYHRGSQAALLGTSSGAGLVQSVYQFIELKVLFHASAGTVEIRVDGVEVLSLTSQNTLATSTAVMTRIDLVGANSPEPAFDSMYVLDDSGSDNTDFLGEVFVETLVPDADGNVNDFTRVGGGSNNWEAVDDIAPPDDDTTYNHSVTATDQELYGFAALAGNIGTIFAVEASALVRKEDPGFREIQLRSRSNVTEVDSPNKGMSLTYRYINHIFENDPDGGTDWDEAAVNAAEFGIVLET